MRPTPLSRKSSVSSDTSGASGPTELSDFPPAAGAWGLETGRTWVLSHLVADPDWYFSTRKAAGRRICLCTRSFCCIKLPLIGEAASYFAQHFDLPRWPRVFHPGFRLPTRVCAFSPFRSPDMRICPFRGWSLDRSCFFLLAKFFRGEGFLGFTGFVISVCPLTFLLFFPLAQLQGDVVVICFHYLLIRLLSPIYKPIEWLHYTATMIVLSQEIIYCALIRRRWVQSSCLCLLQAWPDIPGIASLKGRASDHTMFSPIQFLNHFTVLPPQ